MTLKRKNVEVKEFDKEKIKSLIREGFEILSEEDKKELKKADEEINFKELTVKELKLIAKDKGLTISNTLRKDEIIEILEGLE